jgi:hypothetical protein
LITAWEGELVNGHSETTMSPCRHNPVGIRGIGGRDADSAVPESIVFGTDL